MNYESLLKEIESCAEWNEYTITIKNRVIDIINSYAEKEKWILAKDYKPKPFEDVILQTFEGSMYIGWWDDEENEFKTTDFSFGKPESQAGYGIIEAWRNPPEQYKK